MAIWYCNAGNGTSTGHYAIAQWAAGVTATVGDLRRQLAAPAVGSERVFRCTTGGTTGGAEPTWVLTKGATTADNTAVWTEVTGNSAYGWTACHARLTNATNNGWPAAGDTVYVASASAETQGAAATVCSGAPGAVGNPLQIYCVNAAGSVPPVAADFTTGATVTTTVGAITIQGYNVIRGVSFVAAANVLFTSSDWCESCNFTLGTSSFANGSSGILDMKDCTVTFSVATNFFNIGVGMLRWWGNSSALLGTGPNQLVNAFGGAGATGIFDGVDLSVVASGKKLFNGSTGAGSTLTFNECKLASGVIVMGGSPTDVSTLRVDLTNSDSAATDYRFERYTSQGSLTTETTIVRTTPAGASDGTTPYSWKVVTNAQNWFYAPFECFDIVTWVSAAAHTVTVDLITDNVILTNADVWADVLYMGSGANPEGSVATTRTANILTAGTNLTTSGSTWTTTGLVTPKPQSIAVSFTPAMAGYVRIRVKVAKVSTTLRVDPNPVVT